jgi:hypothetical protein
MHRNPEADLFCVLQLGSVPEEVLRARRTAAQARACLAVCGLTAAAMNPHLTPVPFASTSGVLGGRGRA